MPQRQKISVEEKAKNVQAHLSGEISISEAARRSAVARPKVEEWARNYQAVYYSGCLVALRYCNPTKCGTSK